MFRTYDELASRMEPRCLARMEKMIDTTMHTMVTRGDPFDFVVKFVNGLRCCESKEDRLRWLERELFETAPPWFHCFGAESDEQVAADISSTQPPGKYFFVRFSRSCDDAARAQLKMILVQVRDEEKERIWVYVLRWDTSSTEWVMQSVGQPHSYFGWARTPQFSELMRAICRREGWTIYPADAALRFRGNSS